MRVDELLVQKDISVLQAMRQLDITAKRILFVISDNRKLCGSLTDGDIRRWILSNGNLDAPVENIANREPKYVTYQLRENAVEMMKRYHISAVPVVNESNEVIDIVLEKNEERGNKSNELEDIPVVIMAGGKGVRLYPYTKILPKPLIPVKDVPIIERIMNEFNSYGCKDFNLIVNHKKNMIKAYFAEVEYDYNVDFFDEDVPLGTGGGLYLLKDKIHSTFILSNCDILIKDDLIGAYNHHKKEKNIVTMICATQHFSIPYGVVEISNEGRIESMREKPSLSFLTNTGCYIVEARVIEELEEKRCLSFPDIIEKYKKQGEKVGVYPISEQAWLDMGQIDELKKMEERLEKEI